ncbi:MAG TPA: hypothetical protein VLB67_06755 [Acidimicrobiia bacterium]|nr:hypothetical protein [Acidimicrobiia bacterium]
MRMHVGTLVAGIVYLAVGLLFVAEALEWWTLQVSDLRYVGPLALVVAGIAVVASSLKGQRDS